MSDRFEFRDEKSTKELVVELLVAYRIWIVLALASVAVAIYLVEPSLPEVEIARAHKVAITAALIAGGIGALPASKILDWLYDPPRRFLVVPAMKESADPGIWEMTPAAWDAMDVVDGELYQWEGMKYPTYEAESFDEETWTAEGTWRGSKPDSELLRTEKKVEELRAEIEPQADMSIDLELSISSRVRKAVKAIGRAMIDEHASATTYEGEKIKDVLSEIRQDVEEDADAHSERRDNGEKPVRNAEIQAGLELLDQAGTEAPADD